MDHEALKSLLNTPQPSGKLARWGMALQELDLTIEYRTGRKNEKAYASSQHPVSGKNTEGSDPVPHAVIAATSFELESQRSLSLLGLTSPLCFICISNQSSNFHWRVTIFLIETMLILEITRSC